MAKKDKVSLRSGTAPRAKAPRKPQATTLYPKYSLVEALKIAEAIRDNNAGQPYNRVDLAASLETSPESSSFRILITAQPTDSARAAGLLSSRTPRCRSAADGLAGYAAKSAANPPYI